jgi:hypothetical protein
MRLQRKRVRWIDGELGMGKDLSVNRPGIRESQRDPYVIG